MKSFKEFLTERISGRDIKTRIDKKVESGKSVSKAVTDYLKDIFPSSVIVGVNIVPYVEGSKQHARLETKYDSNGTITLIKVWGMEDENGGISSATVHELVHAEQLARAAKVTNRNVAVDPRDEVKYFGDKQEINAYAIQAAIDLVSKDVSPSDSVRNLRLSSGIYNKYYKLFGKSKDRKRRAVWKRFLKYLSVNYKEFSE